jgi:integrase
MKAITKNVQRTVPGLSKILNKMEKRMSLANYAESTVKSYTRTVRLLGTKLGKSPDKIEQDELHEYLLSIKDQMSQSSWHTHLFGVKYAYCEVLEMLELVNSLPKSKREYPLPVVLNKEELAGIFASCRSLKHVCIFKLAYGTGMRMGEIADLRLEDIDSERMQIRVVHDY